MVTKPPQLRDPRAVFPSSRSSAPVCRSTRSIVAVRSAGGQVIVALPCGFLEFRRSQHLGLVPLGFTQAAEPVARPRSRYAHAIVVRSPCLDLRHSELVFMFAGRNFTNRRTFMERRAGSRTPHPRLETSIFPDDDASSLASGEINHTLIRGSLPPLNKPSPRYYNQKTQRTREYRSG